MCNNKSDDSIFKIKNNEKIDRGDEPKDKFPSSTDLSFENSAGIINDNEYEVKSEINKHKEKSHKS